MRSICTALVLLAFVASPHSQTAAGSLEGTAIHSVTGAVLAGVPVQFGSQTVTTDSKGHFAFEGIAPGQYRLGVVSGSNYIGTSQRVALSAGQHIQGVVFSMSVGGSVIGHVLDPQGKPRSGVTVNLAEWSYQDGQTVLNSTRTATTDDRGGFQMSGLFPGDYAVIAERTYFPGTMDRRQAKPVVVAAETESSGIDFRIQPQSAARISGRVVMPDPAISANAGIFILIPRGNETPAYAVLDKFSNVAAADVRNTGGFEIWNVPPGDYDLYVQLPGLRSDSYSGRARVRVGDDDLNDVILSVAKSGILSGRITVDGVSPAKKSSLQIAFRARDAAVSTSQTISTIAADGASFTSTNLPAGEYRVIASGMPADAYLSDILQNGRSVFADGVVTVGGEPPPQVEINISTNGATVEGNVQSSGKVAARTIVSLVPVERGNINLYKRAISDANGHFLFQGVGSGDYLLFAWSRIGTDLSEQNAAFLRPYESQGQRVSVQAGGHLRDIPVRLISR